MKVFPPRVYNRIAAILEHIPYYSFQGQVRLARDAGVSKSAVSRLLSEQTAPSFAVALAVTTALETRLGRKLDPRELLSLDGHFPTPSVCDLCGCRGCLPSRAYNPDNTLRPEFRHVAAGAWSLPPAVSVTKQPTATKVSRLSAPTPHRSREPIP